MSESTSVTAPFLATLITDDPPADVYARIAKSFASLGLVDHIQGSTVYQGSNLSATWCWFAMLFVCLGQEPAGIIPSTLKDIQAFFEAPPNPVCMVRLPLDGHRAPAYCRDGPAAGSSNNDE